MVLHLLQMVFLLLQTCSKNVRALIALHCSFWNNGTRLGTLVAKEVDFLSLWGQGETLPLSE